MTSQTTPADYLSTLGFAKSVTVLAWSNRKGQPHEPYLVTVSESSLTLGYIYEFHDALHGELRPEGGLTEWPPHFGWRPLMDTDFNQWSPT